MNKIFDRTKLLLGEEKFLKIKNAKVTIVGVGGVGGACVEMLARAGVGNLTLIDFDVIDETNINRQLIASIDNIGESKIVAWSSRVEKINPKCNVTAINLKLEENNIENLIDKETDIVIDAIDMVTSKIALIEFCVNNKIEIISAMGAGNRIKNPVFKVMDIFKTSGDGLAKVLRKKLKEKKITKHSVVCCESPAEKIEQEPDEKVIGSISYFPVMAGCVISEAVILKITE